MSMIRFSSFDFAPPFMPPIEFLAQRLAGIGTLKSVGCLGLSEGGILVEIVFCTDSPIYIVQTKLVLGYFLLHKQCERSRLNKML